eukprot:NODE_326_length_9650_cov_0.368129.p6 type:complete len:110 gc:universal NODE_326_length_9650_cov_0.368129:938-1267(+)
MNNATNGATGEDPSELLFQRKIGPIQMKRYTELRRNANHTAYNYRKKQLPNINSKMVMPTYKRGDKVFIINSWKQGKLDYYYNPDPVYFVKKLSTNIAQLPDSFQTASR